MNTQLSESGKLLEELIEQGLVVQTFFPWQNSFPSARVVLPVYDSNGANDCNNQSQVFLNHAQLARRS
jgi:hypothetical protein